MTLYLKNENHTFVIATDDQIRDAFQALSERKMKEAQRSRMTDAEKDLEAIEKANATESFELGKKIIHERNRWKTGGSIYGQAEYTYWDGSILKWRDNLNPGYTPHWG